MTDWVWRDSVCPAEWRERYDDTCDHTPGSDGRGSSACGAVEPVCCPSPSLSCDCVCPGWPIAYGGSGERRDAETNPAGLGAPLHCGRRRRADGSAASSSSRPAEGGATGGVRPDRRGGGRRGGGRGGGAGAPRPPTTGGGGRVGA